MQSLHPYLVSVAFRGLFLSTFAVGSLLAVDANGGHRNDNFTTTLGGGLVDIYSYTMENNGNGDSGPGALDADGELACNYSHATDVRQATLLRVTRVCDFNVSVTIDLNMSWYNTVNPLAKARGFGYGIGRAFNGSDVQANRSATLAISSSAFTGSVPIPGTGLSAPFAWNTGTGVHTSEGMTGSKGKRIWQANLPHNPGAAIADTVEPVVLAMSASSYSSMGTSATVTVRISILPEIDNPAVWQFPEP